MTVTVTLDEEDIRRAIQAWLREKGYEVQGPPRLTCNSHGGEGGGAQVEARADVAMKES